jgi:hypothetical protein
VRELNYPLPWMGKPTNFRLNDEPAGGLQAFAVLLSRRPLPSYADYQKQRGEAAWSKLPGGRGVWLVDEKGIHQGRRGLGIVRGEVVQQRGVPPIGELRQSVMGAGVQVVEVLAFPVRAKEDN